MAHKDIGLEGYVGYLLQGGASFAASVAVLSYAIAIGVAKGPLADIPSIQEGAKVIAHFVKLSPLITFGTCGFLYCIGHLMGANDHSFASPRPTP